VSGDTPYEYDATGRIEFEIRADMVNIGVAAADLLGEDAAGAGLVEGDALAAGLLNATQTVERQPTRIVKSGDDDLDRLARRIAETLAQLALDGCLGGYVERSTPASDTGASSMDRVAGPPAKPARRGTRFT
jgi:hypothetical protein